MASRPASYSSLKPVSAGCSPTSSFSLQDLRFGQPDPRPGAVVVIIRERHHGVEPVVAAGHLQHHEDGGIAPGRRLRGPVRRLRLQRGEGVRQERRHRPRQRPAQDGPAQELAPGLESNLVFHTHLSSSTDVTM